MIEKPILFFILFAIIHAIWNFIAGMLKPYLKDKNNKNSETPIKQKPEIILHLNEYGENLILPIVESEYNALVFKFVVIAKNQNGEERKFVVEHMTTTN